ncbi:unnamed protein product, partial [Rotaria magnacalcarata]
MSFGFDWDLIWVSRTNVVGEQLSLVHLSWNRLIDNQYKLLPLFDDDLILKFFGQKNSSSNEREMQVIKMIWKNVEIEFMKYFHTFSKSDNEEVLPLIKYLIENENTTVYQYRIGGHVLVSIDRAP